MIYVKDEMMKQEQMYAIQRIKAQFAADVAIEFIRKSICVPNADEVARFTLGVVNMCFGDIKEGGEK